MRGEVAAESEPKPDVEVEAEEVRGWERIVIGEEGLPHGVQRAGCVSGNCATCVKPGRWERPVPPIMAIWRGPVDVRD